MWHGSGRECAGGLNLPQGLHSLVQGNEQGVPREEVPPRPGVLHGAHRKAIVQGWCDHEGGLVQRWGRKRGRLLRLRKTGQGTCRGRTMGIWARRLGPEESAEALLGGTEKV